jgi:Carbohydrate-binding family 9
MLTGADFIPLPGGFNRITFFAFKVLSQPMETLEVIKLTFDTPQPDLKVVSEELDRHGLKNRIDKINWPEYPYKPDVSFSIGYTRNELLLKYYIAEDHFKAEKTGTNQPVYEDSCVEFFVSPGDAGIYYNLEFNGIGTCLMGSGTGRIDRTRISPEIIDAIRRITSVGKEPVIEKEGTFSWTITIAIPFNVFICHRISDVKGKTFRANFYKCGDKLRLPHYITWNPVRTDKPDFHQPEYFGTMHFI